MIFPATGQKWRGLGEKIVAREPQRSLTAPHFGRGNPQNQWATVAAAHEMAFKKSNSFILERETGIEPATFSMARKRSAVELLPLVPRSGVEPEFQLFQSCAVTTLATSACNKRSGR